MHGRSSPESPNSSLKRLPKACGSSQHTAVSFAALAQDSQNVFSMIMNTVQVIWNNRKRLINRLQIHVRPYCFYQHISYCFV
jgi:hypothetical protein